MWDQCFFSTFGLLEICESFSYSVYYHKINALLNTNKVCHIQKNSIHQQKHTDCFVDIIKICKFNDDVYILYCQLCFHSILGFISILFAIVFSLHRFLCTSKECKKWRFPLLVKSKPCKSAGISINWKLIELNLWTR